MRFKDWGVPDLLSLGLITSDQYIEKKRDLIERFVPPFLVDGLLHSFKLMRTKGAAEHTLGWIEEGKVKFTQDLLYELGQIKKKLPVTEFFTNEFLSGPPFKG
jgi:hypothetical protein